MVALAAFGYVYWLHHRVDMEWAMTAPTTPSAMEEAEKIVAKIQHDAAALQDSSWIAAFEVLPSRLVEELARALSERDERHGALILHMQREEIVRIGELEAQLREREREKDGETLRANTYLDKVKELKREVERLREALMDVADALGCGKHPPVGHVERAKEAAREGLTRRPRAGG